MFTPGIYFYQIVGSNEIAIFQYFIFFPLRIVEFLCVSFCLWIPLVRYTLINDNKILSKNINLSKLLIIGCLTDYQASLFQGPGLTDVDILEQDQVEVRTVKKLIKVIHNLQDQIRHMGIDSDIKVRTY